MHKLSYIPDRPGAWWQVWVLPLIAVVVAWGARQALQPVLGAAAPYLFFVGGVLVSTWWGGRVGGFLATVLGGLIANFRFVGLPNQLDVQGTQLWDLVVFLAFCGGIVLVEEALIANIRREMQLNDQLNLVGRELRHRIKNLLTVAEALSRQTSRYATSVEEFDRKLVGRLRALVTAQDMLADESEERASVAKVVTAAVAPYLQESRLAGPIAGPDLEIERELVVPLALILNELATNSVKYGALSAPQGLVKLDWIRRGDRAEIHWTETGGPPVPQQRTEGFGTRLLRSALPKSLGSVQVLFEPPGLRCEIMVAVAEASPGAPEERLAARSGAQAR
jgi:two-component sensor histidine kinase